MKKIIIVIVIIAVAFVAYALLISGKKESSTGVTKQAVGTTSSSAVAGTGSAAATLDGPGKEFVSQLLAIQNIKFNLAFFADPVFRGLQDWSREIMPQEVGRPNPFAPLEGDSGVSTTGFSGSIGSIGDGTGAEASATPATTKAPATRTAPRANTTTR